MKTYRYKIITVSAAVLSVVSCQKDIQFSPVTSDSFETAGLVFHATLENTDVTKTTIAKETDGYKVSWEASDTISVNGILYKAVPDASDPSDATFTKVSPEDPDPTAPYDAFYPASIYDGSAATLPARQVYVSEGSVAGVLPMYAHSGSTSFHFKNLCGLMKFTLKGTEKISSIMICDAEKALSGSFTVNDEGAAVSEAGSAAGVTLDCGRAGVQLTTSGKTFYVAVPAGSYSALNIAFSVAYSAYHYRTDIAMMNATGSAQVERNKVYPFTLTPVFKDYFCITAREAGTTVALTPYSDTFAPMHLSCSLNGGPWQDITIAGGGASSLDIPMFTLPSAGDRLYFRADGTNNRIGYNGTDGNKFSILSGKADVSGNMMYLLNGATPATTFTSANAYAFSNVFNGCTSLINASSLILPATKLANFCYYGMFLDCSSLETSPDMQDSPTLAIGCYQDMFSGCSSLSMYSAPGLHTKTLVADCYKGMFRNCSEIYIVGMSATNVKASNCLYQWLDGAGSNLHCTKYVVVSQDASQSTKNAIKATLPSGTYSWIIWDDDEWSPPIL